jgi:PAS domain S-box-containing protein
MTDAIRNHIRDLSLRKKLTFIIMATTTAALLLAYSTFIFYDVQDAKRTRIQHLRTLAGMIGYNCAAAMTFDDPQDAAKTMAGLAAEQSIEKAIVYKPDYRVFAEYGGPRADGFEVNFSPESPPCTPGESRFWRGDLFVMQPIELQGTCIGYVLLQSGLAELNSRAASFIMLAVLLAALSLMFAMLLTWKMQTVISGPILHLASVARDVTENRDYSARAAGDGRDEVGVLVRGFNDMLSQIQTRDGELRLAQEELQHRADELQAELAVRLEAEREAARMRGFLQNVIDSMPSVVVTVDTEGRVQQWNAQAERFTGMQRSEALGKKLEAACPELSGDMERIYRSMRSSRPEKRERVMLHRVDSDLLVDILVYPLLTNAVEGAVIRVDDATERVRMEEMMIQTEKMMSVGGLAAGMAHEINNPLGIIVQNVQNVLRRVDPDLRKNAEAAQHAGLELGALNEYMDQRGILGFLADINAAGKRAATIVSNMLNFSRKSESTQAPTDLGELLRKTAELAASDYDLKKKYDFRHIQIVFDLDPALPKVPCVETKIEQVLLNLLKNAAQAIAQHGDAGQPRIVCRTRLEGAMARLEIEDNGPGMPEAVRRRVFEPFFTTKEVGAGTGLGLSVSYFIITDNHKGTMHVESSPGAGATFVVRLPLNPHTSEERDMSTDVAAQEIAHHG